MTSREYCATVAEELETWSQKLHGLSDKIDRVPSAGKDKLQPQIEELHMIMTKMDDRLCEMAMTCPTEGPYSTRTREVVFVDLGE